MKLHIAKQEIVAAEYVLGSLTEAEHRRAEILAASDPGFATLVDRWATRLLPLALALPPVTPSPGLWRRIEARIAPVNQIAWITRLKTQLAWWRWSALGAAAIAAALTVYLAAVGPPLPDPPLVATLSDATATPSWVVTLEPAAERLTALSLKPLDSGQQSLELWAIPPDGRPRSLGLLAASGRTELPLPNFLTTQPPGDLLLAVSREPPGGSPTGSPTGPVLFQGGFVLPEPPSAD